MISILYVDDEPGLLDTGKQFLEKDPEVHVTTAPSVKEALDTLKCCTFDTIIADYEMPEINGIEFLKIVKEEYPKLPFILFTGKGREDVVIEALNNGADYYVKKGGNPKAQWAELLHKVRQAVELRESEKKVARLNRIYAVLSHINEAVVRIHDRMVLVQEACKIAVQDGGFTMAWIGFEDPETRIVSAIVASGTEGDIFNVRISTEDKPVGRGPTATAIRERRAVIIDDVLIDPTCKSWSESAARRGYRSVAAFPLSSGKTSRGAITFLSQEPGFFTDSEIQLLTELSEDISFALETIELEEVNRNVREELEGSEHRLINIVNFLPEPVFAVDMNGKIILWNRAMEKITGAGADEVLGAGDFEHTFRITGKRKPALLDLLSASDAVLDENGYCHIRRDYQTLMAETQAAGLNGKHATIRVTAAPLFDEKSQRVGAIESVHDITGFHLMEEKCRLLADSVDQAVLYTNPENEIVSANRRACDMLGYSAGSLEGKPVSLLLAPENLRKHLGHMLEVEQGSTEEYELLLNERTGKEILCTVTSVPFRNGDGNVLGALIVMTQKQTGPEK